MAIKDHPGFQGLRVFGMWLLGGMAGAWTMHILWSIDAGRSIAPGLIGLVSTAFTTAAVVITLIAVDRKRRGGGGAAPLDESPSTDRVESAPRHAISGRPDYLAGDPPQQPALIRSRGSDDTPDSGGTLRR